MAVGMAGGLSRFLRLFLRPVGSGLHRFWSWSGPGQLPAGPLSRSGRCILSENPEDAGLHSLRRLRPRAAEILGRARGRPAVLAPTALPCPGRECLLCPCPEDSHAAHPLLEALTPYLHLPRCQPSHQAAEEKPRVGHLLKKKHNKKQPQIPKQNFFFQLKNVTCTI